MEKFVAEIDSLKESGSDPLNAIRVWLRKDGFVLAFYGDECELDVDISVNVYYRGWTLDDAIENFKLFIIQKYVAYFAARYAKLRAENDSAEMRQRFHTLLDSRYDEVCDFLNNLRN